MMRKSGYGISGKIMLNTKEFLSLSTEEPKCDT